MAGGVGSSLLGKRCRYIHQDQRREQLQCVMLQVFNVTELLLYHDLLSILFNTHLEAVAGHMGEVVGLDHSSPVLVHTMEAGHRAEGDARMAEEGAHSPGEGAHSPGEGAHSPGEADHSLGVADHSLGEVDHSLEVADHSPGVAAHRVQAGNDLQKDRQIRRPVYSMLSLQMYTTLGALQPLYKTHTQKRDIHNYVQMSQ